MRCEWRAATARHAMCTRMCAIRRDFLVHSDKCLCLLHVQELLLCIKLSVKPFFINLIDLKQPTKECFCSTTGLHSLPKRKRKSISFQYDVECRN